MLIACSGKGDADGKSGESPPAKDAAAVPGKHSDKRPEDVRYDNTISGLTRLMRDLRVAISTNDEPEIAVLVASLRLPDHEAWMQRVFGEELGKTLAAEYAPQKEEIGLLVEILAEQYENGLTEPLVERFRTPDVQTSTGYQSAALKKMNTTVPLYSVRLVSENNERAFHLWSFVHDKNSFRFIGKLRSVTSKRASGGRDLNEYRLEDAERLIAQDK